MTENLNLKLTNPAIPTVSLPTGETVLAGRDRKSDPLRPMKYGNETQASTKLDSVREDLRKEGKSGAVVRQGNRFLIFVYENEPVFIGREPRELIWGDPADVTPSERREEESDAEEARYAAEISAIERGLIDIHAETASRIFNKPVNELTPDERRAAKTINYEELYETHPSVVLFDFEGPDWTGPKPEPKNTPTSSNLLVQMNNTPNMGPDQVVYVGADLGNTAAQDFDKMLRPFQPDLVDLETDNLFEARTTDDSFIGDVREALRRAGNKAGTIKFAREVRGRLSSKESNFVPSQGPGGPGKVFATVNGPRTNPRNRHNQHHEDGDGKELHRFVSDSNKPRIRESVQASGYWNEKRRREALKYKLTGGFNDERKG